MSKLLVNENPLVLLPSLAKAIGVNEAIFVQQLHYWLQSNIAVKYNDRLWIVNTLDRWSENFPFWSKKTVQRTIATLCERNIIETTCHNARESDRTLWYTINYNTIDAIETTHMDNLSKCHVDKMSKCHVDNLTTSLKEEETRIELRRLEESKSSAVAPAPAVSSIEIISSATVNQAKQTDEKRVLEEEKRRNALASVDAYHEYMEYNELIKKAVPTWNATDFVKFLYCGMAKYNSTGPVSFPVWAKDCNIMKLCIKKYGCINLHQLVITICKRREELQRLCGGRELIINIGILTTEWIMANVVKLAFAKEEIRNVTPSQNIELQRAAEERAAAIRHQLEEKRQ